MCCVCAVCSVFVLCACVCCVYRYIDNVISHPGEEKYRKIRSNNKAFKERVESVVGGVLFLEAVGFTQRLLPHEGKLTHKGGKKRPSPLTRCSRPCTQISRPCTNYSRNQIKHIIELILSLLYYVDGEEQFYVLSEAKALCTDDLMAWKDILTSVQKLEPALDRNPQV